MAKIFDPNKSLAVLFPDLAAQAVGWNPKEVTAGSHKKLRWRCERNHEWDAIVKGRGSGKGCPICSGKYVQVGFNDLMTTHPDLASQAVGWNPIQVSAGSNKKLKWRCEKNHEWYATVADRTRTNKTGCPVCVGKKVQVGSNDLATTHPDIASQAVGWDPKEVTAGSNKKLKWRCELGHEWDTAVKSRVNGHGCSYCSGKYVLVGFNDLALTHPDLAREAIGWSPSDVSAGSDKKLRWKCELNHEWDSPVSSRVRGYGCPVCAKTGFDPTKDAWIYFLDHDEFGMFQIGITNQPDERLGKHRRKGWTVLEIRGSMRGELARKWEVSILEALKRRGAVFGNLAGVMKFDGFTESWLKSSVTVSGLKELMDFVHEDDSLIKN